MAAQRRGMPIVAWWPNIVITFELTMLGAILTTVVSMLVAARLPTMKKALYDPAVSDGKSSLVCPSHQTARRTSFVRRSMAPVRSVSRPRIWPARNPKGSVFGAT